MDVSMYNTTQVKWVWVLLCVYVSVITTNNNNNDTGKKFNSKSHGPPKTKGKKKQHKPICTWTQLKKKLKGKEKKIQELQREENDENMLK